ncbi:MAG TPA: undecaprenyl-diphosphate phosphatase [Acidimicrobiales bacterium]
MEPRPFIPQGPDPAPTRPGDHRANGDDGWANGHVGSAHGDPAASATPGTSASAAPGRTLAAEAAAGPARGGSGWRAPAWSGAALVGALLALLVLAAVVAGVGAGDRDDETDLRAADAVLLGLVEGVTEWLPISSTGHLTVTQDLLGIDGDAADSYAIAIQAGAILAVLILYRERFLAMARGVRGDDPAGRHALQSIVIACLPAVAVGLLLEDTIKDNLFGSWPVVVAWLVGGLAILAAARARRHIPPTKGAPLTALDWQNALIIGVAQTFALWPGVSRSLVTILAALAVGLSVPAAVEFSFLLGFVTLGGATAYETLSSGGEMLDAYGLAVPLLGLAVAFVSAVVAMRWMVDYLNRRGLEIFGWYRIVVAVVVSGLLLADVI